MTPQRLAGFSDRQWSAVRKALSYARVTRFDSMAEFLQALGYRPTESTVAPDVSSHVEFEDSGGSAKWAVALVILLSLLGVAGYQFGIFDEILERFEQATTQTGALPPPAADVMMPADIPPPDPAEPDVEADVPAESPGSAAAEVPADGASPLPFATPVAELQPSGVAELESIDLGELAQPDLEIFIDPASFGMQSESVTLREDGPSVVVDVVRAEPLDRPMTLRLEEVGFSGNRSPWRSGQFEISNGGYIELPAGEATARVTLAMASDDRREADQASTLRVREADTAAIALARIDLVLEDDDQRRFEAELPPNTVAFTVSQVSVRERDPAVQVDLVRFNPDETRLVVNTEFLDITATAGEDFFPPGNGFVVFGPGQRSARILIPLVQDAEVEGDEVFVVQLITDSTTEQEGVHTRVAVMIRDDD